MIGTEPSFNAGDAPRRSNSSSGLLRRTILAAGAAVLLCACATPTPPIAHGLPRMFGPSSDFDVRIKQRFPVGSSEGELVAELHAEKFALTEMHDPSSEYRRMAHFEAQNFPCKESWTVRWAADRGKITDIEGRNSGDLCL
jgi:hypothetical protein